MKPKKSLGQHFLTSHKIIQDMVDASLIHPSDTVLEIGPGKGILTKCLLQTGAHVIAIEKDSSLLPELGQLFEKEIEHKRLTLMCGDVLTMEIPEGKYKVVANIPYYITGQIIRMFLETASQPETMSILIQKEVADRILARDNKESLLSLSVKIFGTPRIVRTVSPGSFNPPPTVDSAVLTISNISRSKLGGVDEKKFFNILHLGFAHKRKQLLPNLSLGEGNQFSKEHIQNVFITCNLDIQSRAEDVSLEKWIELAKSL